MKLNPPSLVKDNKDIIFDLLSENGVESFEVAFDGQGDDGNVEEPSKVIPKKAAKKFDLLMEENIEGARVSNGTRFGPDGPETVWNNNVSLKDLIENVCYDTLEAVCAGWEINEGSWGTFIFDVKKRKVHLDFNERVVESNHTGYDF